MNIYALKSVLFGDLVLLLPRYGISYKSEVVENSKWMPERRMKSINHKGLEGKRN